jgi:hypothetical protein
MEVPVVLGRMLGEGSLLITKLRVWWLLGRDIGLVFLTGISIPVSSSY